MRTLFVAALFLAAPACAYANDGSSAPSMYTEFSLGASFIPTVSTKTYTITDGVNTATGRIDLKYDTSLTGGVELGAAGVGVPEIRLGLGYDYLRANFSSGVVVGTLNGAPGSFAFNRSDLSTIGISLDNNVHVLTGNVTYDLPNWGAVTPYLGGGAGAAFIEHANTELVLTASAGVRVAINADMYVGVRYRFYRITGPTDAFGIQYDDISNHSVMALFGMSD
jgi:opacity protein-like surface antigen